MGLSPELLSAYDMNEKDIQEIESQLQHLTLREPHTALIYKKGNEWLLNQEASLPESPQPYNLEEIAKSQIFTNFPLIKTLSYDQEEWERKFLINGAIVPREAQFHIPMSEISQEDIDRNSWLVEVNLTQKDFNFLCLLVDNFEKFSYHRE